MAPSTRCSSSAQVPAGAQRGRGGGGAEGRWGTHTRTPAPRRDVPHGPPRPAGDGWVHKALNLGARVHLVEELQVFQPAQPVESLVLAGRKVSGVNGDGSRRSGVSPGRVVSPGGLVPSSLPSQKLLFAGSRFQVAQLPLADCGRYQSCTDCVLARDPYCAWSRNASLCVRTDGLNG